MADYTSDERVAMFFDQRIGAGIEGGFVKEAAGLFPGDEHTFHRHPQRLVTATSYSEEIRPVFAGAFQRFVKELVNLMVSFWSHGQGHGRGHRPEVIGSTRCRARLWPRSIRVRRS